jgi:acyl carrier protein
VLRPYLTGLGANEPIDPDVPLSDLGLGSIAIVGLMIDLETRFDFVLAEERVTPATFYTAGSTWSVVNDAVVAVRHSAGEEVAQTHQGPQPGS